MNRFGLVLLGAAMLFGCSDDNNNIDGPVTSDAKVFDGGTPHIDGGPTIDGGASADASTLDAGAPDAAP